MNPLFAHVVLSLILCASCEPALEDPYTRYEIHEGSHGAFSGVELLQSRSLKFSAIFDETAIYTTRTEENQHDVNKLLGFADCNAHHHVNSARFGWRWLDGRLEILAYCYNNGQRIMEPVGSVEINKAHDYQIRITDNTYLFYLDDLPAVEISRTAKCNKGVYYVLFPYFGGDETSPHDMVIKILRKY